MASASTAAWTAYQKFCQGVLLYRQEKNWEQMGAPVGRATLSNWLIKNARESLKPMFDYFHRQFLKSSFVIADETPFQVLNEKDKKPASRKAGGHWPELCCESNYVLQCRIIIRMFR